MQVQKKFPKPWRVDWYVAVISLFLVLRILAWFSPSHAEKINFIYLWPLAIVSAVLVIVQHSSLHQWRFMLPGCLVAWLWIGCIVNGDAYLVYNRGFILGVFVSFICFFLLIPSLSSERREKGLQWIAVLYCGLMLVMASLGLYVALTGHVIQTPFSDESIRIFEYRLYFFRYHPNEASSAFVVALYLLLFLFASWRNGLARAVLVLAAAAIAWTIALTGSRTAILLAAGGLSIFVFWAIYTYLFQTRLWLRWLAGIAVGAVLLVALYFGLSFSVNIATTIAQSTTTAAPVVDASTAHTISPVAEPFPAAAQQTDGPVQSAEPSPTAVVPMDHTVQTVDSRVQLQDIGTFNARVEIWQTGLDYLKAHPMAYLFGVPDNIVSRIPHLVGRTEHHMHNAYLEMLLLGGIPGLALYGLYLLLLAYSGLRLAFDRSSSWGRRFLAVVPLLLAANGVTEIYPLFSGNVMDMMYFAISGAVIAFAMDLPPFRSRLHR